jgi:F-type H+-transporting ATPase subunit delta
MPDRSVARRYAVSFVELAVEAGEVDRNVSELASALDLLRGGEGRVFEALCNPVFTLEERQEVLVRSLVGAPYGRLAVHLLHVLLEKGRMSTLPEVVDISRELADVACDRVRVRVSSAVPLDPALEAELRTALAERTRLHVVLETRVDPDLIAGVVADVGGKVYDASLRARLDDLKSRLVHDVQN